MPPTNEEALFALAVVKPAAERARGLTANAKEMRRCVRVSKPCWRPMNSRTRCSPRRPEPPRPTIKLEFAEEPDDEAVGQTLGRYKLR